jgi:hypothetical protein
MGISSMFYFILYAIVVLKITSYNSLLRVYDWPYDFVITMYLLSNFVRCIMAVRSM